MAVAAPPPVEPTDGVIEEARDRQRRRVRRRQAGLLLGIGIAAVLAFAISSSGSSVPPVKSAPLNTRASTSVRGTVLYERWEKIVAPEEGNRLDAHGERFGPDQLWIQGTHPRSYRLVLQPNLGMPSNPEHPPAYGASMSYVGRLGRTRGNTKGDTLTALWSALAGRPLEIGGTVEAPTGKTMSDSSTATLTYLPSDELFKARLHATLGAVLPGPGYSAFEEGADPVSVIRAAIKQGWAREAGLTSLDGRTLERIDFKRPAHPPAGSPPTPAHAPKSHLTATYFLVAPATFHPVALVSGGETYRWLTYEYLPATAANLALTNIQKQHPKAKVVGASTSKRFPH